MLGVLASKGSRQDAKNAKRYMASPHKLRDQFRDKMSPQDTVVEKELWVENRLGLHARPVAKIATAAQRFEAEISLEKDGLIVDARDLLAVLALDCPQGTRLVLRASGPQAREAAAFIASLFARKFEEP